MAHLNMGAFKKYFRRLEEERGQNNKNKGRGFVHIRHFLKKTSFHFPFSFAFFPKKSSISLTGTAII